MLVWIQNPFDAFPTEGSRKLRYWLMAEAFVRAGHQVVLWTSDFSHVRKERRTEGLAGSAVGGFEVRLVPALPYAKNVSLARIRSHREYARKWVELAKRPGPRPALIVTSIPTLSAAAAAIELGHCFGARVVVDVMDAWPETFERLLPKGFRWLLRILLSGLRRQARCIYRSADLVTGVSERYRELTGRADYHLAYHGIELSPSGDRSADSDRRQVIRLAYVGNLGKTYDLATVVKAVEDNPDFELDVAGFGEFSCACSRVRFRGLLAQPDLQALLAQADIGIVPMRSESWVGVPYKFCDYAQAGLAIVSSLGGESSALLAKYRCGENYAAGDVRSFAAAVRRAAALDRGASRTMCAAEFDARRIYDDYVSQVTHD